MLRSSSTRAMVGMVDCQSISGCGGGTQRAKRGEIKALWRPNPSPAGLTLRLNHYSIIALNRASDKSVKIRWVNTTAWTDCLGENELIWAARRRDSLEEALPSRAAPTPKPRLCVLSAKTPYLGRRRGNLRPDMRGIR